MYIKYKKIYKIEISRVVFFFHPYIFLLTKNNKKKVPFLRANKVKEKKYPYFFSYLVH